MPAGKLVRIYLAEHDRRLGKPLYEAIVEKCHEMRIVGATVFRGLEGYGETAEMHRAGLIRHDQPIVIAIVDSAEKVEQLIPVLEEMLDTGLIAVSDVEVRRVRSSIEG